MTYRIDDAHGQEIGAGFSTEAAANTAADTWEKRTGRTAYVSEDVVKMTPQESFEAAMNARASRGRNDDPD